jgi:hypothetical protein
LPPRLEVELAETKRFQTDRALHGLEGDRLEAALDILRSDPVVGTQRPEASALWDWTSRGLRITYGLSEELERIVLLRAVPMEAPSSGAVATILRLIRVINDVKRLFGY